MKIEIEVPVLQDHGENRKVGHMFSPLRVLSLDNRDEAVVLRYGPTEITVRARDLRRAVERASYWDI